MRCNELWLLLILATANLVLISSAPSKKKGQDSQVRVKQLVQGEPWGPDDPDGGQWYPTVEVTNNSLNDPDYDKEKEAEEEHKAKEKIKADEKKESNPNVKTFCEDGSKNGKCSDSNEQVTQNDQSLDALLVAIKDVVDKHDSLDKKGMEGLREQIAQLSGKVLLLQLQSYQNCANNVNGQSSNASRPRVAEIEETHIVERKIMKANKDRQDKKQTTGTLEVERVATNSSHSEELTLGATGAATVHVPPIAPPAPDTMQPSNVFSSTTINYLEQPAEVNYNGGINRPMDALKHDYPDGKWPGDDDDDDDNDGSTETGKTGGTTESVYYDDDEEGKGEDNGKKDFEVINISETIAKEPNQ